MSNVTMRRLDPDSDESLVREAVAWIDNAPRWFRDADAVWGRDNADDYLEQMRTEAQADFGVWDDGEFIAVVTVSLEGKGTYNSHLMAKRGARVETLILAVRSLMKQMFEHGMKESWNWIAARNFGVVKILEAAGMQRDGVSRIKGQTHGRPIQWLRYSVRAA